MSLHFNTSIRDILLDEYPSVWDVRLSFDPDPVIEIFANPRLSLCSIGVSRFVADFIDPQPYTISVHYDWGKSSRLDSIVKQLIEDVDEGPTMSDQKPLYLYVIFGQRNGKRVPFGSFSTRAAAESAVENGSLQESMSKHGLRLSDCDHYTVERWEVGRFLEDPYIKTLTSYDRNGSQMMRFQETASGNQTHSEVSGRLASILNDSNEG